MLRHSSRPQFQISSLKSFRVQLMSELIQNETASEERLAELEFIAQNSSERLGRVEEEAVERENGNREERQEVSV